MVELRAVRWQIRSSPDPPRVLRIAWKAMAVGITMGITLSCSLVMTYIYLYIYINVLITYKYLYIYYKSITKRITYLQYKGTTIFLYF